MRVEKRAMGDKERERVARQKEVQDLVRKVTADQVEALMTKAKETTVMTRSGLSGNAKVVRIVPHHIAHQACCFGCMV